MREVPEGYSPTDRQDISIPTRPTAMPLLTEGQLLICEYVCAPSMPERSGIFICDTVEGMQLLFDSYASGLALRLNWYTTHELTRVLMGEDAER